MPDFAIVARRFTPAAFVPYLAGISLRTFLPSMVVLHNTAVPTLADRPQGFSEGQIHDLEHYYAHVVEGRGWSGGPHLFVDDLGIWGFNPLDKRGVHSPSWNAVSWGVEMLGDYETEGFDSGRGAKVRDNAVAALAAMFAKIGAQPDDAHFKLHHEDPRTTHACPGRHVAKEDVRARVRAAMAGPTSPASIKVVAYRKGRGPVPTVVGGSLVGGATMVDERVAIPLLGLPAIPPDSPNRIVPLRPLVQDRYDVTPRLDQGKVYLVERP